MSIKRIREAADAWIADSADVVGDVTIGKEASIWYQAVVRGDEDRIVIGDRTNIQDGCVIHADRGFPAVIGEGVTVGHKAILHGCSIGDNSLIGMGAIVLNGAKIGKDCLIGAGALVTGGTVIPDGMLAVGSPAVVKKPLTERQKAMLPQSAEEYVKLAKKHFQEDR